MRIVLLGKPEAVGVRHRRPELGKHRLEGQGGVHGPLATKIRPKDHIDILRPLLPERYSPLQPNGNGLQSVYLTEIPVSLAEVLMA